VKATVKEGKGKAETTHKENKNENKAARETHALPYTVAAAPHNVSQHPQHGFHVISSEYSLAGRDWWHDVQWTTG
jgi:hypothetical protein